MRRPLALVSLLLASTAVTAAAQAPDTAQPDRWHATARDIYREAVNTATVQGRGQVPALANRLAERFRAAGFTDVTIHPYDVVRPDDHTAALIVRWPAAHPSNRKAMLLMAHMDVVEARRSDWSRDPFQLGEQDGYFYGRGSLDDKMGVTAIMTTLLRLKAEGFQPNRDIIVLFTGDEETGGRGAELAASQWLDTSQIDFALNGDAGGGAFRGTCSASASRPPRRSIRTSPSP
jgi:acetylornithine deacetylase/succinyl-diaminopimelate desuccinylase-like protein